MNRHRILLLSVLLVSLLVGCASGPKFDTERFFPSPTPEQVSAEIDAFRDYSVLWGGVLINSSNQSDGTRMEVLAYPLRSNQRPNINKAAVGRFLLWDDRYLELVDYAPGRSVTIIGKVGETVAGKVGESDYIYPVLDVEQIYLWPKNDYGSGSDIHFGVGVIFGN